IMGMGLATIVGPLAVLGDVIPFIGSLIRGASGFVAFALAGVLSLVVIAIAWFTYRPMLSIPLLVGAGALAWWVARRGKGEAAAGPPAVEGNGSPPPMNF
ncbi:MAG: TMEM43 family protein, partial [Verrucomicrobiales bacterium]|nr:TMEM43 family protein [Verrucomicrobiales bacterium]